MKSIRKAFAVLFVAVISLLSFSVTAGAAEVSNTQDGLVASITSVKESYNANEDIDVTFKVTNTNDFAVENVSLEAIIPNGLTLKNKANTKTNTLSLASGESLELNLTAFKENTVTTLPSEQPIYTQPVSTEETKSTTTNNQSDVSVNSNTNNGSGSDNNAIKTGNNMTYLYLSLICLACIVVGVIAFRFRKHSAKFLSLLLCACISVGSLVAVGIPIVSATEETSKNFNVNKAITVDNSEYELSANVTYISKSDNSDIVTRGKWVDMLVNEFSMKTVDLQETEEPYTDINNSEYRSSIITAYYNAILPTDSAEFKPEAAANRDFAVFTLNNCLCYLKNDDLNCNDYESIKYKDDASALVERGYFSLINNNFMPEKEVTVSEMDNAVLLLTQLSHIQIHWKVAIKLENNA